MMALAAIVVWAAFFFVCWECWQAKKNLDAYYKRNPQMKKKK